jgi:RimJ/RimL family protein N-acetyltransferase
VVDSLLHIENLIIDKHADQLAIEGLTDRLFIRSYNNEDFERCLSLYGDRELTRYFDQGRPRTQREIFEYVGERGPGYFDQGLPFGIFSVFLRESNEFVGQVDLVPTDKPGEVEIGWIFRKEFHHQGLCTEAVLSFLMPLVHRLVEMKFKAKGVVVNRVIATAHPKNIPSNKIIQKAGLIHFQTRLRYGGKPRNWYGLDLKAEECS